MSGATLVNVLGIAAIVGMYAAIHMFGRFLLRRFGYGRSPLRGSRMRVRSRSGPASRAPQPVSPFGEERRSSPFGDE